MVYKRISPGDSLKNFVECYWIIENNDPTPVVQKIIPDGFTEIIFHYGDPYKIKLGKKWERQKSSLLAGQISKHFFLKNTGRSGIFGIKLKPTALTFLFGLDMSFHTDRVVEFQKSTGSLKIFFEKYPGKYPDHDAMIAAADLYFNELTVKTKFKSTAADVAVKMILNKNGMVTVAEMCEATGIGERQLQYLFRKYVGLTPKFYARIIRFSYIFQLIQKNDQSWSGMAYDAAFYDQSHFIRNFKNFTGENPSHYKFDEKNMANFFLMKHNH